MNKASFLGKLSAVGVVALTLSVSAVAFAQESKIGFVNTERVLREANIAKTAQARMEQEFAKRDKELQDMALRLKNMTDKLDKDAAVMSESDRLKKQREVTELDKEFQRRQREFREDVNQRRNEELASVLDKAQKTVRQVAESEKYDVILQEAVYANPRIDITEKVLKALNNSK